MKINYLKLLAAISIANHDQFWWTSSSISEFTIQT
jgi:hypothetical protein